MSLVRVKLSLPVCEWNGAPTRNAPAPLSDPSNRPLAQLFTASAQQDRMETIETPELGPLTYNIQGKDINLISVVFAILVDRRLTQYFFSLFLFWSFYVIF